MRLQGAVVAGLSHSSTFLVASEVLKRCCCKRELSRSRREIDHQNAVLLAVPFTVMVI